MYRYSAESPHRNPDLVNALGGWAGNNSSGGGGGGGGGGNNGNPNNQNNGGGRGLAKAERALAAWPRKVATPTVR